MQKIVYVFCVICVGLLRLAAQQPLCLSQAQIDSKSYAVRVAKDYGLRDEVLGRLNGSFGGRIYTLQVKEGSDCDIISFGSMGVKDFKLYDVKRDSSGVPLWVYDDKKGKSFLQTGKLIAQIAYLDRLDNVVLIETSTPGSGSIGGIVRFSLENGIEIEYFITEDGLGSDRFYDEQGREYVECRALELN